MRICGTIVDGKRRLVGFMMENEFVGSTKSKIPVTIESLVQQYGKNGVYEINDQIRISGGRIHTGKNFKLSNMPMFIAESGEIKPINNSIKAVKRITKGGENIGFSILFADGASFNLKVPDIFYICSWFKPVNFICRKRDDGASYICGVAGTSLNELPEINTDSHTKDDKQPERGAETKPSDGEQERKESRAPRKSKNIIDFLDVMSWLYSIDATIVGIVSKEGDVNRKNDSGIEYSKEFKSYDGVVTYSPWLTCNESNLGATISGRIHGTVNTDAGVVKSYIPFTKNIIHNADVNVRGFKFVVDGRMDLQGAVKGVELLEAKDNDRNKYILETVEGITGKAGLKMYIVRFGDMDVVSAEQYDKFIIADTEELNLKIIRWAVFKLQSKYCSAAHGVIAAIKKSGGAELVNEILQEGRKIKEEYRGFSEEQLRVIDKAGVDVYSGAYRLYQMGKAEGNCKEAPVEIKYAHSLCDSSKITFKIMDNLERPLPERIEKMVLCIRNSADDRTKVTRAAAAYKEAEEQLNLMRNEIWKHKVSMYLKYGGKIHQHDKGAWNLATNSRKKNDVYICNVNTEAVFSVECVGTSI